MSLFTMPIVTEPGVSFTWDVHLKQATQARTNHGNQTLETLASRHGLSWCELYLVFNCKRGHEIAHTKENEAICRRWLSTRGTIAYQLARPKQ